VIAACLKWVDRRPEVDPLTGAVHADARSAGASEADQAALESALRAAAAWNDEVVAITAGPGAADAVLREAVAAGATRAVRVDLPADAPSDTVAAALAAHLAGCDLVWCGDASLDRGSGSVPAYLAAHLGAAQALGLVTVELGGRGQITALRRLDGGRRERLRVTAPGVCSVEGSAARLRRAPLAASLAARTAPVDVRAGPAAPPPRPVSTRPFRPRARALAAPAGATALDRITALTASSAATAHGRPVVLEPAEAADRILEALRTWGYVEG
jgi:electron transfer flavoprotein beta subunit